MRTIDIKGKKYVPVSERVKEFRNSYPDYRLYTEIVNMDESSITMRACVANPNGDIVADGYANEEKDASNINRTSYVENCQTSAIGRALGILGIGIDAEIGSADEIAAALERQELLKSKVKKENIVALKMRAEEKGSEIERVIDSYGLEKIEDMTLAQWQNAMELLGKKK